MKVCALCKESKSITEFSKDRSTPDGLQYRCRQCWRDYYIKHKARLNKESSAYQKERRRKDPTYLMERRARCRVRDALDGIGKESSTMKLLGCTAEQFREHIESQFVDGMSWNQRGQWHIDHKIPIVAFNLTKPKHQRYAFHWSNCQPLWAMDNLRKSDKYCPKQLKKYLASTLIPYGSQGKDEKR